MKNFLLAAIVLLVLSTGAQAQKVYFIFLQSENNQPFFVKMADKIYSSSSSGYLIIPDLKENSYNFNLGFANQNKPEANFTVEVTNTDRGLLIKNTEDGGVSLFDLQSLAVYKPVVKDVGTVQTTIKKTDSFTQLLSKAADDESILTTTVTKKIEAPAVKEEKKEEVIIKATDTVVAITEPVNTIDTNNSVAVSNSPATAKEPVAEEKKTEDTTVLTKAEAIPVLPVEKVEQKPVVETAVADVNTTSTVSYTEPVDSGMEPYKKSVVIKRSESSTTEGFGLVFLDDNGGFVDTIRLLIPNPKIVFAEESIQPAAISTENTEQAPAVKPDDNLEAESQKTEKKGLLAKLSKSEKKENPVSEKTEDITQQKEENTVSSEVAPTELPSQPQRRKGLLEGIKKSESKETAHTIVNGKTVCAAFASDNDFLKLRRNMAAKTNDDEMVNEAKKIFRSKCFSTEQIKNLSYLFLSPQGKYQFFDAAYIYVVDQWQFATLENEIKDEYYQKRFKALIAE